MKNKENSGSKKTVWVMGHKNPDADAICSAIAYADFLQKVRLPEAQSACCGNLNSRTEWVIKEAGVEKPKLINNVYLTVNDICNNYVVTARPYDSVIDTYNIMKENGFRSLPVLRDDGSLQGLIDLQSLLPLLITTPDLGNSSREVKASISSMSKMLKAKVILGDSEIKKEENFFLVVAGSSIESMESRIKKSHNNNLLIIMGDRVKLQKIVIESGIRCLVITGGFIPDKELVDIAKEKGTIILSTEYDTALSTQIIKGSRSIESAISTKYIDFNSDVLVHDAEKKIRNNRRQFLFPVCNSENGKLTGVFSKSNLVNPEKVKIILVDHNEFSQSVNGIQDADIIEVVDHHRLSGDLSTKEPIRFINMAVGSTCTIVGINFKSYNITPSRGIALCICAGIISDTLGLTSPTTTEDDKSVLNWASKIADIDIKDFKNEFFLAGSALKTSNIKEIINSDRKNFQENGYKISISQVEEIGFDSFWPIKDKLENQLDIIRNEDNLYFACLMITDITQNNSLLLIQAFDEIYEKISYPKTDSNLFVLDNVVSRKKQLFPYLGSILEEMPKKNS